MGLLDSLKGLFGNTNKMRQQIDETIEKADSITDMIPGDADDKLVDNVQGQVKNVTDKLDDLKKNIPGN